MNQDKSIQDENTNEDIDEKVTISLTMTMSLTITMLLFLFIRFTTGDPTIVFPKLYPDIRNMNNTRRRVFFGLVSMPGDPRQDFTNIMWLRELVEYTPHDAAFLCKEGKELPGFKYLHPGDEYNDVINKGKEGWKDRDRAIKRYVAAKYFYENTTYDWYWSATDDVYVDIPNLQKFLDHLNAKYDPNKDLVFKSHTIYNRGIHFPQGGVGMIFSRKAVGEFLKIGIEFVKSISTYDDVEFWKIRKYFNMTITEIATPYMFGHGIYLQPITLWRKLRKIKECPPEFGFYEIFDQAIPVKDMVAYHSLDAYYEGFRNLHLIAERNDRISYYYGDIDIKLCLRRRGTTGKPQHSNY